MKGIAKEFSQGDFKCVYVSLYGLSTADEIVDALFRSAYPLLDSTAMQLAGRMKDFAHFLPSRPIEVGDRFGRRVVIADLGRNPAQHQRVFRLRCDGCGSIGMAAAGALRKAEASCTCEQRDRARRRAAKREGVRHAELIASLKDLQAQALERERRRRELQIHGFDPHQHPLMPVWDRLFREGTLCQRWMPNGPGGGFRDFATTVGLRPSPSTDSSART